MTGASRIEIVHMNHINVVVGDFGASVEHFRRTYGAQLILDIPRPEWHACLITIGTVILELFVPHEFLLNARYGPHYVGLEYQVTDMRQARRAIGERSIRLVRDIGDAIHTHPADTLGVAIELFDKSFHSVPPPTEYLEPIKPISYWRDEHPLGCTGLRRYTIAVEDVCSATDRLRDLLGAQVVYERSLPQIGAVAVGLAVGDTIAELQSPVSAGVVSSYLATRGAGLRSTVFSVADVARARSHLTEMGMQLVDGDVPGAVGVPAELNCGIAFEFEE